MDEKTKCKDHLLHSRKHYTIAVKNYIIHTFCAVCAEKATLHPDNTLANLLLGAYLSTQKMGE